MQTYQDKISLNFNQEAKVTPMRIDVADSISINEPVRVNPILNSDDITPIPQTTITPTQQVERGAPETKSQASANNNFQPPPTNMNSKGFMPPTPNNQISGGAKNAGPRFSSEVLHSMSPEVKSASPEWRLGMS